MRRGLALLASQSLRVWPRAFFTTDPLKCLLGEWRENVFVMGGEMLGQVVLLWIEVCLWGSCVRGMGSLREDNVVVMGSV